MLTAIIFVICCSPTAMSFINPIIKATGIMENSCHSQCILFLFTQTFLMSDKECQEQHAGAMGFCMGFTIRQPKLYIQLHVFIPSFIILFDWFVDRIIQNI